MQRYLLRLDLDLIEPRQVKGGFVDAAVLIGKLLLQIVQGLAALCREPADVLERHTLEAVQLCSRCITGRLRRGQLPPRGIGVFERDLRPEACGGLHGDGAWLVLASGRSEHPCSLSADEHPPVPEGAGAERLPEVQLALTPGKSQGAGHT